MKILAIDGNSMMNRAFYGIRLLTNTKGFYTNALTGFMNIYLKTIKEVKPDGVVAAFDVHAPTFRHKEDDTYKANRKGMPEELRAQMPVVKEILTLLGTKVLEIEGYEADDILGSVSHLLSQSGEECVILTGDRDSLQLVNDNVTVYLAKTKETIIYTPDKIKEDYGLDPIQLIDVKALQGDSSDNIKGVAGIGEKTALSLIREYGSVDKLYDTIDESDIRENLKHKLINGKDDAYHSKWLGTIVLDAPIDTNLEYYLQGNVNEEKLYGVLAKYEMFKLIEKLDLQEIASAEPEPDQILPDNLKTAEIKELEVQDFANFTKDKTTYFVYTPKRLDIAAQGIIFYTTDEKLMLEFFKTDCKKICFEGKEPYKLCMKNETELKNIVFIADLAGYLLNSQASGYSVMNLCLVYNIPYRKDVSGYEDIASLEGLCERLKREISEKELDGVLYDIEIPLCEVLASMENLGVRTDADGIKTFGEGLSQEISILKSEIFDLAGREFNIASPKQLGEVLFEDLGLPFKKKTKSGYSTSAEVLEELREKHPIIPLILDYRTLTKLNSTYVEGLLKVIREDGRVHSFFNQTETRTGRISSSDPNMQNIPVRKELGRMMRKFFIAKDGYTLLDADYSQIELRILAHACDDENLIGSFLSGKDFHAMTASKVFDMPIDFVTDEMRRTAKIVNFGIVYGIGAFSLSNDLGVSVAEAKRYIEQYHATYPGVKKYMDKTVEDALKTGYVTTMYGRRRYIPELVAKNKMVQAFGKRAAMNAPIQGTAADIIKIAMIRVYRRLKEEQLDARLILQVHDELIIEVSEKDKDKAAQILSCEMTHAASLAVPLIADVNEGKSWYDAKG